MKIAVIDNYDSFVYNLVRYLDEQENTEVHVFRNDRIDYEALESSDAILLSPGSGIPSEAGDLMSVIDRYHNKKPILGVCLGHQAIAEFFGGKIKQNELPLHGKASTIKHSSTGLLFDSIPEELEVGRYHSWSVERKLPSELNVTAETSEGEIMAMEHQSLPISGVQFHPESILTPHGRTMIKNWIESITISTITK